jgi:hypothetical protein
MQILRLHWRSLMPWDRSPDNHLTSAQRRDYLMASLGWFRDLLMLAFSLLLLAITGLLATHSSFAVVPLDRSLLVLPLLLMVVATICIMFTQRHWTTLSYRRALLSLVISLAVTFVIARGCIEGVARRDGVFLRTAKGGGRRTAVTALKLTRWEMALAVALYVAVGVLAALRHPPWLLIFLIFAQGTVYLCGPIASVWNLRTQAVPGHELRRRLAERRLRAQRRRRARVVLPRPATATLTALCIGGVTSVFVSPASLLHATTVARRALSPQSLLASPGTDVYLRLGSSAVAAGRAYYPITPLRLSALKASSPHGQGRIALSFDTSSVALLGEALRAAGDGGQISYVSLAFRTPGSGGRPATELVDTFATGVVSSIAEHLSESPTGSVSLLLPSATEVTSTPDALRHVGPFARLSHVPTAQAHMTLGQGLPPYAVTAVGISQPATGAPLNVGFTTSALPLLQGLFQAEGTGAAIPALALSVRDGAGGSLSWHPFSRLRVSSLSENLSGPVSGTATLAGEPG